MGDLYRIVDRDDEADESVRPTYYECDSFEEAAFKFCANNATASASTFKLNIRNRDLCVSKNFDVEIVVKVTEVP